MALPALAELGDLTAAIGGQVDFARAQADLDEASALIRDDAGVTWLNESGDATVDVPDIVRVIALRVARRGYLNPTAATQLTAGDVSTSHYVRSESAIYLTDDERTRIRRAAGTATLSTGFVSVATERGDLAGSVTTWVPTVDGPPFPWYGGDVP